MIPGPGAEAQRTGHVAEPSKISNSASSRSESNYAGPKNKGAASKTEFNNVYLISKSASCPRFYKMSSLYKVSVLAGEVYKLDFTPQRSGSDKFCVSRPSYRQLNLSRASFSSLMLNGPASLGAPLGPAGHPPLRRGKSLHGWSMLSSTSPDHTQETGNHKPVFGEHLLGTSSLERNPSKCPASGSPLAKRFQSQ